MSFGCRKPRTPEVGSSVFFRLLINGSAQFNARWLLPSVDQLKRVSLRVIVVSFLPIFAFFFLSKLRTMGRLRNRPRLLVSSRHMIGAYTLPVLKHHFLDFDLEWCQAPGITSYFGAQTPWLLNR